MLRTFPNPYPDELLYSIIARYHIISGNTTFKQTVKELFNYVPQQLYGLALPNNLNFLVKNISPVANQTVINLISNHTLYDFYKSFLTQPEAFLLKDLMKKKVGKPIFQAARMAISGDSADQQFLRFCRHCLEEDLQKYGETYWHRTHQIPGVLVCLVHETLLDKSLVPLQQGYLDCYVANPLSCQKSNDATICQENTLSQLLAIAKEISWLCSSQFNFKGFQWLRRQYQNYLAEQSFVTIASSKAFKFHSKQFVEAIYSFYSQDCLHLIKPSLAKYAEPYFYRCLFTCDIEPAIDRITHILLMKFLLSSLKDFLEQ